MFMAQDHFPEFSEKVSLHRLREKIRLHLLRWAVLYIDAGEIYSVLYKKIPDIDVSGFWSAGFTSIFLEPNRALIVLIKNVLVECVPLCF